MNGMYIDLIIVAIVLIFSIIGLSKGFFKTLIGFFGFIAALLISFFLAGRLAAALLPVGFVNNIFGESGSMTGWFAGKIGDIGGGALAVNVSDPATLSVLLKEHLHVPEAIGKVLADAIVKTNLINSSYNLNDILASAITSAILWLICAALLFIALRIVVAILKKLVGKITKNRTVKKVDRLFGALLGAVKGAAVVLAVFVVMSFMTGFGFMANVNQGVSSSTIGGPVSNAVYTFVGKNISVEDLLNSVFKGKITAVTVEDVRGELNAVSLAGHSAAEFENIDGKDYSGLYADNANKLSEIKGLLGDEGFSATPVEIAAMKTAATAVKTKYTELFVKLGEYNAELAGDNDPDTIGQIADAIEDILKDIDAKWAAFEPIL